jgi:single-stranded-DNA-specific exonuclease
MNTVPDYAVSCLAKNYGIPAGKIRSQSIGYNMTPQINAMGRIDDARDAVTFLTTTDPQRIESIAIQLKDINDARKKVESKIMQEVETALFAQDTPIADRSIIFLTRQNWPTGVIGLVAGKLMHRYGKPTFLLSIGKDGIAKGSCRSIPQFNVYEALTASKDILTSFGGHTCAAGLALKVADLPTLEQNLTQLVTKLCTPDDLSPRLHIDAEIDLPDVDSRLMDDLERLEPYGNSNPVPSFVIRGVTLLRIPKLLKEKHVKCMIFSDGMIKPVIFFGRPDIYKMLIDDGETPFDIACQVVKNEWNGTSKIELLGLDIARP